MKMSSSNDSLQAGQFSNPIMTLHIPIPKEGLELVIILIGKQISENRRASLPQGCSWLLCKLPPLATSHSLLTHPLGSPSLHTLLLPPLIDTLIPLYTLSLEICYILRYKIKNNSNSTDRNVASAFQLQCCKKQGFLSLKDLYGLK